MRATPEWMILAGLAALLWATFAWAVHPGPVAMADLLAQPDKWHRKRVVVSGTVGTVTPVTPQRGSAYYTFLLSDGPASVTVFSYGTPEVREGQRVQVEGIFHKVKRVGNGRFPMWVDARRIQGP